MKIKLQKHFLELNEKFYLPITKRHQFKAQCFGNSLLMQSAEGHFRLAFFMSDVE